MKARLLSIRDNESFFLWGPRQVGKSSLLKARFPENRYFDLLDRDLQLAFKLNPKRLREEVAEQKAGSLIIIDEVQKVPELLDEVHWLIENRKLFFGLSGSSARKVKRGHANLLGGRAFRYELSGFVSAELGNDFSVERILNHGYLPRAYFSEEPKRVLHSYITDYLKEEIADEGLVRNLPSFARFLDIAAISDTETINYTNIASDCGVSRSAVVNYFQILEDTLISHTLPAFTQRIKRRLKLSPKFYFTDVGIVNQLAKRGKIVLGSEVYGKAFENWIFHELHCYIKYKEKDYDLSYWSLPNNTEVDFIVGDLECAIECKASINIDNKSLKGLRELKKEHDRVKRRIVVCFEERPRIT
ncbi:MAG: ATP-binding protein, partial [Proteobacteria bacterium]|nr:ATP-binding protein [Pseudomonadota bacterium]